MFLKHSDTGSQSHAHASRTAELMAVQRGLESCRRPGGRLFDDPYAPLFVSRSWRAALTAGRVRPIRRAIEAAYDRVAGPGPRASAIARTRLIDDLIEDLAPSVDQIVTLGAGYDTRPYRLKCLESRHVFEVDHPDTQQSKRAVMRSAAEERSRSVTFVPVDFETEDLSQAMLSSGFRTERSSLFLWEGVTQYLSEEAVDSTLAAIRRISRAEDFLIFTYVDRAVLSDGATAFPEAQRWIRGVQKRGEPWTFGLCPEGVRNFLSNRGFGLMRDMSTEEAGDRYFSPLRRADRGSRLYHVVLATRIDD